MSEEDRKKPKTIGDYRIGKVLGTGSYGYVRLGVNIITGEQVYYFSHYLLYLEWRFGSHKFQLFYLCVKLSPPESNEG